MNIREDIEKLYVKLDNLVLASNEMKSRIDEIEQQLEPEITEGQYVFIDGFQELHRVVDFDSVDNTYGVVPISDKDNGSWEKRSNLRIASGDEVEQALIKEGRRRGFDKAEKWKPLWETNVEYWKPSNKTGYTYDPEEDTLFYNHTCIYYEGEFAEIIEDEWEVGKYDTKGDCYYVTNGSREIDGTYEALSKKEAQAIANALNNLDND